VQHHAHERGFFYHFVDAASGKRAWQSEASTIDTALLLQGALFAREYLRDREVDVLVDWIYARIDWPWAMDDGRTLTHGWRPESGFIDQRWERYSELLGMYLLGIGAPRKSLPAESWHAWGREPRASFGERTFIHCAPLFTHQYAHAWFDFRGNRDAHADYWQNSVDATLAQRAWSAAQQPRYKYWSNDFWGLTASDSEHGYIAWGTPGPGEPDLSDGTVVPCAPGGSLPFAPAECVTALRRMREVGGPKAWGRYGFVDAFNPHTGWAATEVNGINVGITLVMAENLRTGMVWRSFMRAPEVRRGMQLAGFSGFSSVKTSAVAVLATMGE
ncbi:MAG: glucoamylase family protein, partial [Opitutaceae bacterium]